MHLNNKIRRDVAMGLARKAVAKHGDALTKQFVDLNADFWKGHAENVKELIDIPRKEWGRFMQAGVFSSTCKVEPLFSYKDENDVLRASCFERNDARFHHDAKDKTSAIDNICCMPEFKGISKFLHIDRYNTIRLVFSADDVLPRITGMEKMERGCHLYLCAMGAMTNLSSICKAFIDTYGKLIGVVDSVKTEKQLLELLPEAKEFLPPPAPKESKSLVPVEYVQKLRDSIAAGVPNQLGGA